MRRILTFGFSFAGMFCISYYIEKFYVNKGIEYNQIEMVRFSIAFAIIMISLIISILNYLKLNSVRKQNIELSNQIFHLSETLDKYHYSQLSAIEDNMECILDKGDK